MAKLTNAGCALALLMLAACGSGPAAADTTANDVNAPAPRTTTPAPLSKPAAVSSAADRTTELPAFWTAFREAALAGDTARLRALSAPIVIQHGELDDDPKIRVPARAIPAKVAAMLARADAIDAEGRSLRSAMEATSTSVRDPAQPRDYHRFGDLVFKRGAAGWRLAEIYVPSDD